MTLLPVLYQTSGFGGRAPTDGQRRFIRSTDDMLHLLERLKPLCKRHGARLGLAPHSLRAVPPDALTQAVRGLQAIDPTAPIHIHIAEQAGEVDACLAWSGQRPVQWLLDHAPVDERWCLVHATHMTPDEYQRAARSGAVAGICPSTEANLGDGIFDMTAWRSQGGRWGVGSDSHACVNAAEELMLLEYSQRLATRQRNVLARDSERDVATAMTLDAVLGGAQAAAGSSERKSATTASSVRSRSRCTSRSVAPRATSTRHCGRLVATSSSRGTISITAGAGTHSDAQRAETATRHGLRVLLQLTPRLPRPRCTCTPTMRSGPSRWLIDSPLRGRSLQSSRLHAPRQPCRLSPAMHAINPRPTTTS